MHLAYRRRSAPPGRGATPSTTCRIRSASPTSSSVERNASTSWCGRCRTKPTVSASVNSRPSGVARPAHGRVQGGEQRVLDQHARAGQPVEQRGLARVGVSGDGDRWHLVAASAPARLVSRAVFISRDLAAQLGHPLADPAPVGLDLGLTGATGADAAAARRRDRRPAGTGDSPQPRSRGSMYCICASATCALPSRLLGVLGEDVEDQGRPVDDLDLDDRPRAGAAGRGSARRRRSRCRRR